MSELKATTVHDAYWKAASNGDSSVLVYLKSEADKVIVEQTTLRAWAELQLRHHKFKRCLATALQFKDKIDAIKNGYMVSSINTQYGVMTTCPPECNPKFSFYKRWYKRWLELADKFKEGK